MIKSLNQQIQRVLSVFGIEEDECSLEGTTLIVYANDFDEACNIRSILLGDGLECFLMGDSSSSIAIHVKNAINNQP